MSTRVSALLPPLARRLATSIVLGVWLAACGGGVAPEAKTSGSADSEESAAPEPSDADAESGDADSAQESSPRDPCADGSCFSCGKSVCLPGWYCAEDAHGGPACSWLPECATSPSCKCITKVLGTGCSCKDEGGGLHVTCGD